MLWNVIVSFIVTAIFCKSVTASPSNQQTECGQRKQLARELIHHGHQSRSGEWPWHVAVFHKINAQADSSYACGGTTISRKFVLTAAHCTYPEYKTRPLRAKEMLVRAGIANLYSLEHSLQEVGVEEIVRHAEFNTRTLEDDIALLKLEVEFQVTDYVKPLCLWSGSSVEELIIGKKGSSAGWGEDEKHKLTGALKHVPMLIVSRRRCRDSDPDYYTRFLYDRKMFCAGFRNGSTPASGDSGGGLYIEGKDGKWGLRGILSNGKIEAETRLVDRKSFVVFVDVAYYLPWIRKSTNISADGEDTALFNQDFSTCGLLPEVRQQRPWPWQGEVYRNASGIHRLCDVAIISELFLVSPAKVYRNAEIRNPSRLILTFKILEKGRYRLLHHQRIRHEKFDAASGRNNIALLELISPLKFTEMLRPICLWRGDPKDLVVNNTNLGRSVDKLQMNCTLGINYICIETNSPPTLNSTFYFEDEELWYLRGLTTTISQEDQPNSILLLDVARYTGWIENNTVFRTKNLLNNVDCSLPFINDYTFLSTRAGEMKCFATLVSPSLMLTLASCLENSSVPDLYGTSGDQSSQIIKIFFHPSYNGSTRPNNLAIVQLDRPLDTTPFCILFDSSRTGSRLRLLLPTKGPKKYFFDLDESQPCNEGHICGHFRGIARYCGDPSCKGNFHGSPLFHDFGDGRGVYLRGLLEAGKEDHCEQPELPEVFVDVMFYAGWIRGTVLRILA
ncbi:polyserase-2-like isoform X1 [Culex pipiens pallens]|uniref:polyserase-2-like isoform X1 n=1 Tax=Culex pipiens pallens TaxID=42434 RepID=UPI0019535D79|nr:polyserase-2-like isoform X1 [Culex pipiens pallens]